MKFIPHEYQRYVAVPADRGASVAAGPDIRNRGGAAHHHERYHG